MYIVFNDFLKFYCQKELGCQTSLDNKDAIKHSNVLFLAVKPHILPEVLAEVAPCITSEQLVISVAVAVSRSFIEKVGLCKFYFRNFHIIHSPP